MPTDLEQQLPRFAEALDREAPAISVDEILSRGTVAVDVDDLERPSWDQVPRVAAVSRGDAMPGHGENGERDASIDLVPTAAEPPTRRRSAMRIAIWSAAAAVLVVALVSIVRTGDEPDPADVPPSIVATPPPTTPATETPTSGGMWPQSTLDEVRAAQQLADAGDPNYTWQVGAQLTDDDPFAHVDELELVDRFIREVLGWEAYLFNVYLGSDGNGWVDGALTDLPFLRCAPGRTNPLYPPEPESEQPGESCAPTLDDLRYESVSLDLAQLDRQGRDGIWVVNRWELTEPFAQADPAVVEARATERLEEFLTARIAGTGAEGHVQVNPDMDVPLLYATTSGAPYERYEIERVNGPQWPYGPMTFSARLFADGDATVVEQQISWDRSQSGGLWMNANATTENGQPVVLSYTSTDGEVTVSAPSTWEAWLPGKRAGEGEALDVWFGGLWRPEDGFGNGERIEFVDPVAYDAWCAANGGSPLLSEPADAAAIAQELIADPELRDDCAGGRAHRWSRGRVDRRHPCPRRQGLRGVHDRHQPLDPRAGTRDAPPFVPRRPPRGHVGSDPGDHGRGARGTLRRRHRRDRTDHRVDRVPPRLMGCCSGSSEPIIGAGMRHGHRRRRRRDQGRVGTSRSRPPSVHDAHLPPSAPRHERHRR